jgi:hypothetical protein
MAYGQEFVWKGFASVKSDQLILFDHHEIPRWEPSGADRVRCLSNHERDARGSLANS